MSASGRQTSPALAGSAISVLSSVDLPMPLWPSTPGIPIRRHGSERRPGPGCGQPDDRWLTVSRFMRRAPSQINVAHPRVGDDLRERAFLQDAALMKHRDGARDPADEGHVVLDHHHRRPRIQFQDQLRHAHGFVVAHACRRLVEQNHLGSRATTMPISPIGAGRGPARPAGDGAPQPRLQLLRPVRAAREPQALPAASQVRPPSGRPARWAPGS